MKHFKHKLLLVLLAVLSFTCQLQAQVTIGDGVPPRAGTVLDLKRTNATGTMGGLLLPNVNITDVELIPNDFTDVAVQGQDIVLNLAGTVVYNINATTGEGIYYWDGYKWRKVTSGNSLVSDGCEDGTVHKDGGIVSCTITDVDCNVTGEYSFELLSGKEFSTLEVTDAVHGKFDLTFSANSQAVPRSAIVLVISPCRNSSIFIFTQNGESSGCGISNVPPIKSQNPGGTTVMCPGGAVYLYLDGRPTTGTYIWTLNDVVVGDGHSYMATQAGKYIVYGDRIGCYNRQEVDVTVGTNGAPAPVEFIAVGNNGQACGVGGTVQLIVSTPTSGTVVWYKDGVKTSLTGTQISAGKGFWEAVVDEGGCSSTPTPGVTVTEDTSTGNIPMPVMKINGVTNGWSFCKSGSVYLEVDGGLQAGITYTWYADNTIIGTGSGIYYAIPSTDRLVIRLRATGVGCAQEAITVEDINTTQAPTAPIISVNTNNVLCGGEATLSASAPAGTTSYRWFRGGVEIVGETSNTITITQNGIYTVSAIAGGCTSIRSGSKPISASDFATLSWVSNPATAQIGETKTYTVNMDFTQGATYTWTATGGTITNGQGTRSVTVNFPTARTVLVRCTASNGCGTAAGSPLSQSVVVSANCTDAQITNTANLNSSIKVGNSVAMSVTASGTPSRTYQWYSGNVGSGSAISGATSTTYNYTGNTVGTFKFYCVVSVTGGCASATSSQFTVSVSSDPSNVSTGTGVFSGKLCFDIAFSNNNTNGCAPLSGRTPQRTDFTNTTVQDPAAGSTAPYSGTQVYTFTPKGTVSKVRFDYVDASGKVIENITPNGNYTGNNISSACKVTVVYKSSLNTDLRGLTRANALKAELYAIYNSNASGTGSEMAVKLTPSFQDCACCGAVTTSGGWLEFMCHNLGADESLDPFTANAKIHGDYYQWGRIADGHEKRNSPVRYPAVTSTDLDANKQVKNTSLYYGRYITTAYGHDWQDPVSGSLWGSPKEHASGAKTINDPCPAGWRIPTIDQWYAIYGNGRPPYVWTWKPVGVIGGYMVGDHLFLPAAGLRGGHLDPTAISKEGVEGSYWSADYSLTSQGNAYDMWFNSTTVRRAGSITYIPKNIGRTIRCVAE